MILFQRLAAIIGLMARVTAAPPAHAQREFPPP